MQKTLVANYHPLCRSGHRSCEWLWGFPSSTPASPATELPTFLRGPGAPATGPVTFPSSPPIGRSKGKEWRKFKTEIQAVIGEDASDAFLSCMPSSALRACRLVLPHLVRTPALWSTWKSGKSHPLSKVPCDS